ncbi:MAG: glycosyltransferase [Cytophagales bacterium]|nr:MAG: glycosyltransferase [Cytophagales bacterium]
MKITIITPSFNQGQFLETTIQSVLNQQYSNLEYMIFDGGSNDESVEIIEKYRGKLAYWESKKDRGQSHAINKGFEKATGDIVTWLNSDDQLMPNVLQQVAQYFEENPEIAFLHGKTLLIKELKADFGQGIVKGAEDNDLAYKYLAGLPFPQPSAFFRKSMIEEFGLLNEGYHYGMDYDFFLRMSLNYNGLKVNDILSKYLLHQNSKTVSQSAVFAKDYALIFSKLLRSFPFATDLVQQMKDLGIYTSGDDVYKVGKKFTINDLQKAFCYNLYFQLIFFYDAGELSEVRKLTSFLKKYYPDFYKANAELPQIRLRAKFLTKKLLLFLRKVRES